MAKRYKSVLEMVKDLSSPEFAKEFEEHIKGKIVYVFYVYVNSNDVEVFSSLKSAKKYAAGRLMCDVKHIKWKVENNVWSHGDLQICKRKIIN